MPTSLTARSTLSHVYIQSLSASRNLIPDLARLPKQQPADLASLTTKCDAWSIFELGSSPWCCYSWLLAQFHSCRHASATDPDLIGMLESNPPDPLSESWASLGHTEPILRALLR